MQAESLLTPLLQGNRRALAKAITLVESTKAADDLAAQALLAAALPRSGGAVRLGISGAPGVGKSSFIEAFGLFLLAQGKRLAVLAIDPSSQRSGGSILGDKTRMTELARAPAAFIRPSPSRGTLGGVAQRTREALLLCEAAGYDVVLVETVGVGQSEMAVADMVDMLLLLQGPGGGDELQGVKRGLVEWADLVVVTKADGDLAAAAQRALADFSAALRLLRPRSPAWTALALAVSAYETQGLEAIWATIQAHNTALEQSGEKGRRRESQAITALHQELDTALRTRLLTRPDLRRRLKGLEAAVTAGQLCVRTAVHSLLDTA